MTRYTRAINGRQRAARPRGGANLIKPFSVRIVGCNRLHEAGIASNRGSACRGEYVPGPCTHRPSHHEFVTPEVGGVTFWSQPPKVGDDDWGEVVTR